MDECYECGGQYGHPATMPCGNDCGRDLCVICSERMVGYCTDCRDTFPEINEAHPCDPDWYSEDRYDLETATENDSLEEETPEIET